MKQNYTDFDEERLREKKGIQINTIRSSSGIDHREKKFFFREILIIIIFIEGGYIINIYKYKY